MEVEVLGHEGIASDSIVMIRAGSMRRQAKLNAGLPFQFPALPVNANPFSVEIFQPLGSKTLNLSPDAEAYKVQIPATREVGQSTLELLIQEPRWRCPHCGEESRVTKTECYSCGSQRPKDSAHTSIDPAPDAINTSDPLDNEGSEDPVKKASAAIQARDYLQKHNLVNFVQEMLTSVLKEKPADPYDYMSDHANGRFNSKERGLSDTATTAASASREPKVEDADRDDDFGEDREEAMPRPQPSGPGSDLDNWYVSSQQAIRLGAEHCTLTILLNDTLGQIRFEVSRPSTSDTLFAVCTKEQFDELCEEVGGAGSEQISRAMAKIFKEHLEPEVGQLPEKPSAAASAEHIPQPLVPQAPSQPRGNQPKRPAKAASPIPDLPDRATARAASGLPAPIAAAASTTVPLEIEAEEDPERKLLRAENVRLECHNDVLIAKIERLKALLGDEI